VDFYVEKAFGEHDPTTAVGKKAITDMVLPFVTDLFDAIQQDHWVKQLARRLDVSEESIWSEISRRPGLEGSYQSGSSSGAVSNSRMQPNDVSGMHTESRQKEGRRELLEEKFLTLCAMVPEALRERELKEHHIVFRSAEKQNLFALVAFSAHLGVAPSPSAIQDLEMFKFKSEVIGRDIQNAEQEFLVCKRDLERECIKEKMQERQEEIAQKEKEGSHAAVTDLLKDMVHLNKILKQLSAS
jgi:DNA primase